MIKLSHSACTRYNTCGENYRLHYIERLRSKGTSSALIFGVALDSAINVLLEKQDKDPMVVFMEKWERTEINKKVVLVPTSTLISYKDYDFDADVLQASDHEKMANMAQILGLSGENTLSMFKECKVLRKDLHNCTEAHLKYFNYACWLSLARKAEVIVEAYRTQVLPKIKRVISVQKELKLLDDEGNEIIGFIDLIAEWEDGVVRVLDNKSASRLYERDAVEKSPQLTLYGISEGTRDAGFIVYLKNLTKDRKKTCTKCGHYGADTRSKTCDNGKGKARCHGEWSEVVDISCKIQILLGQTTEELENEVLSNANQIKSLIKAGVFEKNLNACDNWYGSPCEYFELCHQGSKEGLEQV